jgi:muramoyltetrapeptide carboxypeptidase
MPSTEWYKDTDEFTMTYLRRALFGALTGPLPMGDTVETLQSGQARGILCGGNLSLVRDSLGTPWELDTRGKILFLEDVGEKTYRLDGMLTQLRNAGKFDDCAGILLGYWTDCPPEDPEKTLEIPEILREVVLPCGRPVLSGLPCGHSTPTMSLPLGRTVVMDADEKTLEALA